MYTSIYEENLKTHNGEKLNKFDSSDPAVISWTFTQPYIAFLQPGNFQKHMLRPHDCGEKIEKNLDASQILIS